MKLGVRCNTVLHFSSPILTVITLATFLFKPLFSHLEKADITIKMIWDLLYFRLLLLGITDSVVYKQQDYFSQFSGLEGKTQL